MNEPLWLPRVVILATHEELRGRFGGLAGIRDDCLLASVLDRPKTFFAYEETTLPAIAAAYAAGIVCNLMIVKRIRRCPVQSKRDCRIHGVFIWPGAW